MLKSLYLVVPAALLVFACGSSGGGASGAKKIDCAYLTGNNCWKTTALAAKSCVPGNEIGTFSADRKSCSFGSGATVTFDAAVPATPIATDFYGLTIKDSTGAACLSIHQPTATRTELVTSGGTVDVDVTSSSYTETCPNGSSYSTSDPVSVSACGADAGGAVAVVAGEEILAGSGILVISISGTGDLSGMKLFGCR